jgi:ribosome-associated protein
MGAEAAADEALRETREIAVAAAEAMLEGKAEDIIILDLSSLSNFADFFVIATGLSVVHMTSLADRVQQRLAQRGIRLSHVEGLESTSWMLLDYLGVLVHIFAVESRNYYGLERLWGDAPVVDWKSEECLSS